ncbi:hypothetical protein [Streptomyces caniscabiei]|uniref:Uncharacterized protein n=1 Tax=Streptomyces caniscabiei TaxID=2746961 RepID=A0A927LEM8_9ACTN|nr:hypothetical protein [Streptomyces caniscabiei]MBD9729384.1 hypothetical protein [Streptomyces caniscabiei]MDX3515050.1 hypothetical protein [Streptomyces caniscabiei]MDX3724330.1 hypothetical protein [Streptomyces caniscabiei]
MPDDDGGKPPKPGASSRKQGRPPKDLSGQSGAQREFADIIRKEFFDRLADLGVTTHQISAALGGEEFKGFSTTSLSQYRAGKRVPDRDKLLRLLAYAEEKVGRPLGDGVREHVLAKYSAALRETNPQLHRFYELMDEHEQVVAERDQAREDHKRARDELVQCQQSLDEALLRAEQLEAEAQRAGQEEARRQERGEAAENEIVRLQGEQDELLRAVRGARAGQQAARKEIRRLEDLLVQQGQETARSEAGLKDENAALAADVSAAAARVAELERTEQSLRGELEQVTAALEQAETRNGELASQHAVVLRSRAEVGQRLSVVRRQRRALEDKLAEATQRVSACMRQLTVAERRVARVESELVAVYRSRDALLDDPTAPGQVVTEAVEAVDAAWQSYEGEIARIEQHAVVPPGETTPPPARTSESPDATAGALLSGGTAAQTLGAPSSQGGTPSSPPAPSSGRPSRDQILRDLKRSNRELDRAMRRLSHPPIRWARVALVITTASAVIGATGYALWASWPDGSQRADNSPKPSASAPTTASSSQSASTPRVETSPDLGKQAMNTQAIMRLVPCTETESLTPVTLKLTSKRIDYDPDEIPTVVFKITSESECRINVTSNVRLSIAPAIAEKPIWNSFSCTAQRKDRWIAVSPNTPATVTYRWNRLTNNSCTNTKEAPAGTYLATGSFTSLFIPDEMASFVLTDE